MEVGGLVIWNGSDDRVDGVQESDDAGSHLLQLWSISLMMITLIVMRR